MLYLYTAEIMAAEAQRRQFDSVRLDRPAIGKPARWRSFLAAQFSRTARATGHADIRLRRPAQAA